MDIPQPHDYEARRKAHEPATNAQTEQTEDDNSLGLFGLLLAAAAFLFFRR